MSISPNPETGANSRPRLLLVHGEGSQPLPADLEDLWLTALGHGIQRDHKTGLDGVDVGFVHHADLTRALREDGAGYDPALDLADARSALRTLMELGSAKKFKRTRYESVPGQTPTREFLADIGAPLSRILGLGERRIAKHMPELAGYWSSPGIRAQVCQRIADSIADSLREGCPLMLIAHGIGTVYTYDALLTLSAAEIPDRRIHTWITLGTPLSDNYVRSRVTAADRRYPDVLLNWHNLSAEDDAICHDSSVADDFAPMLDQHLISRIKDHYIYNLSERYGRSDPHDALGYLIHPRTSGLICDWLREVADTAKPAP